jgi:hypothetical protein
MNDFLKMDIFFAVTTAVVFFFGVMSLVALYYVIMTLRSVSRIARNAADETDQLRGDVALLRVKIREEGMRVGHLMDFFLGIKARKATKVKKESKE